MRKKILSALLVAIMVFGVVQPPVKANDNEWPKDHPVTAHYKTSDYGSGTEYEMYRDGRTIQLKFTYKNKPITVEFRNGIYKEEGEGSYKFRFHTSEGAEIYMDGKKINDFTTYDGYIAQFTLKDKKLWDNFNNDGYMDCGVYWIFTKIQTHDGDTIDLYNFNYKGQLYIKLSDEESPITDGQYTGKGTAKAHTLFGDWNILTLPLIKAKVAGNNLSLSFRANKIDYAVLTSRKELKSDGTSIYEATEGGRTWKISITKDGKATGTIAYDEKQSLEFDITLTK